VHFISGDAQCLFGKSLASLFSKSFFRVTIPRLNGLEDGNESES
jgi:hypothetical protein